uniref:Uncharacterized protein n=1 Tax=Solanum tuberosum TaxID=4113 RepID=M1D9L8_SOLTU
MAMASDIPEGPGAGVGKEASAGVDPMARTSFYFFFAWSLGYSASIFRILVEAMTANSISFFAAVGTRDLLHNVVINIGKGRDVWLFFARIWISKAMIIPRFILAFSMMDPRQAALAISMIDSFCDGIIVLLMNQNQYLAATFKYFFSIETPSANHFRALSSEISGVNQFFIASSFSVLIKCWQ